MKMKADGFKKKRNIILLGALFLCGIIFLILSEYISNNESTDTSVFVLDESNYAQGLEIRLCEIINRMKGVSEASVMVTLESGARYSFAEENSKSSGTGGEISESAVLFQQDRNGAKTPVLTSVETPEIKGVSVVCKGGANEEIQIKIISLISSTLNLPKNRIYVTE